MNFFRGNWTGWLSLFITVVLAVAGTWIVATAVNAEREPDRAKLAEVAAEKRVVGQSAPGRVRAEDLSQAFRSAARVVLPAVVVIKAAGQPGCPHCGRAHHGTGWQDSMTGDADDAPLHEAQRDSVTVLGSGFLVDSSGLVLTNQHVVEGVRGIVVQLADGRRFNVTRIKTDSAADLAVLKIDSKTPLPAARLANSEAVEIGDWVLAVGCPLELEQTVSAGIISAKNRSFCPNHRARMLQTDAAINPGSSGGPLVNLDGEVVGITTSIASEDGGYQGIGFAVPANYAGRLVAQFSDAGKMKGTTGTPSDAR